jgi:V/A-type H+-transporting ATPase subunit F
MPGSTTTTGPDRIAVVGSREKTVAFKAAGLAVFPVEENGEALERVEVLVEEGYRVVFFTEELFEVLKPALDRYRRAAVPCLVALPLGEGGRSVDRLKEVVRKAVGADVFGSGPGDDAKGVG